MVVLSLAQDRGGYIWAGTEGGVYRYDGYRFQLIGQAMGAALFHRNEVETSRIAHIHYRMRPKRGRWPSSRSNFPHVLILLLSTRGVYS